MSSAAIVFVMVMALSACGSSPDSIETSSPTTVSAVSSGTDDELGGDNEVDAEDSSTGGVEVPPEGFILEPANAQLGPIEGWIDVDEWYWEPISFTPSPNCEPLNEVLLLEEWGVITTFRLREGTELYHHTTELNRTERVDAYIDAFASLAGGCPSAVLGEAAISAKPFSSGGLVGFTMTVDGAIGPNWFVEGDTTSHAVITSRNNVVSIVQIVPAGGFDMAEFDPIVATAIERLAGVQPETRPDPGTDLVELERLEAEEQG
ncbi:MAG: hypothetical protein ACR2P0_06420 [Acidimicrobiales bacterium]